MNIIIAGDLYISNVNEKDFVNGNLTDVIDNELLDQWLNCDYRIFNLEAPLTKIEKPIDKLGPSLKMDPNVINGIRKLSPNLVLLANNHIKDFGPDGISDTVKTLTKHNIKYTGIGNNSQSANQPVIVNGDKIIGIYNFSENEFAKFENEKLGSASLNLPLNLSIISELKSKVDYVIVIFHGGKEEYKYPSPKLQELCRSFVDYGANIVICQHTHTIGSYEKYKDSNIIYGQGNFIFNYKSKECWKTGLLINLHFSDEQKIDFIPFKQTSKGISSMSTAESKEILEHFYLRSKTILDELKLKEMYQIYANQNIDYYIYEIIAFPKILKKLDVKIFKGRILKYYLKKNKILSLINYFECESHNELIIEGLKSYLKK
ncbi:MAG: CapA family protein [Acholeplasmataceae bacterium]|nr:CapA family protein [Acholeplasmataceae bacterium]